MNILNLQRRPVANLTLQQEVAVEHVGLDSLTGYVLVVFDKRDHGGPMFCRLVNSGENFGSRFKIPFRDLSQKYFAIAVKDSLLSYSFDYSITLNDGSEELTLAFHLTYRVVDHRKVAERLDHDPLQQLRDEVIRVIGRNCAKRKAEMFRDRFKDLERLVIDSESPRLRPYATELGFKIISIDLDKPLPVHGRRDGQADNSRRERQEQLRNIQDAVRQLRQKAWKDETSRLITLLAEAGAEADTTTRVRDDLEALAARYFPPAEVPKPEVTNEPEDEPVLLS